jgi:hypothetical protein
MCLFSVGVRKQIKLNHPDNFRAEYIGGKRMIVCPLHHVMEEGLVRVHNTLGSNIKEKLNNFIPGYMNLSD